MGLPSYSNATHESPNRIQRLSHAARYARAITIVQPTAGQRILDFGAGDGFTVMKLWEHEPQASYVAFDTDTAQTESATRRLGHAASTSVVRTPPSQTFDTIICFETLEHIPDDDIAGVLGYIREHMEPNGKLIISVPIEIGLSSLGKNIVRSIIGQRESIATLPAIIACALGFAMYVKRDQKNLGHVGFDYRTLPKRLAAAGFEIVQTQYSPLPFRSFLNSQVFWTCRGKPTPESQEWYCVRP